MSEVDYIQKDKANTHFGYKYASEQAIKETLHPLFVKHKVILMVETLNPRREVYTSARGGRAAITDIDIKYTFYDTESGESIAGTFNGTGDDGADKGTYKAITGAIKYILTSTFLIPTGDDPEEDGNLASNQPQNSQTVNHTTQAVKTPVKPNLGQINDSVPFPDEPPFESKPQETPEQLVRNLGFTRPALVVGDKCARCADGEIVLNPKTGKLFCDKKCFLQGK